MHIKYEKNYIQGNIVNFKMNGLHFIFPFDYDKFG